MGPVPPSLSLKERDKAKFYAWVNTAYENEYEFFETEEAAQLWCDHFLEIEMNDGEYSEEGCFRHAIGYARIVESSRYRVTDEAKNYKYKSREEIPEDFTEKQILEAEGDVWPHDEDWDSVGVLEMDRLVPREVFQIDVSDMSEKEVQELLSDAKKKAYLSTNLDGMEGLMGALPGGSHET